MEKIRTRFAPSPTGFMHIGNLRTALYAYLFAKRNGGDFIIRIEDTDQERFVEGATEVIYNTLAESGMKADESPLVGGDFGPYIQSERREIYTEYAKKLVELGGAYYCFCDKHRLESLTDENGVRKYDKHCLSLSAEEVKARLAAGESYVIRQNIPSSGTSSYTDLVYGEISVDYADLEDNILIKSDGLPTYNFANVVDDHLMKISHVMRGNEYLTSTPKYNLMYDCFGWERPKYVHLPPIMRDAQHKLSKRYGDANFDDFVKKGYLPEAIVNYIALLGWSPKDNREKMTFQELVDSFSIEGISKSPSIFDEPKMKWLNGLYIKELAYDEFYRLATPYFSDLACRYDLDKLAPLTQSRVEIFSEIPALWAFLDEYGEVDPELYFNKKQKCDKEIAKVALSLALPHFSAVPDGEWTLSALHDGFMAFSETLDVKRGQLLWAVRIAATAQTNTPGGAFEMLDILGKAESVRRLTAALAAL